MLDDGVHRRHWSGGLRAASGGGEEWWPLRCDVPWRRDHAAEAIHGANARGRWDLEARGGWPGVGLA